MNTPKTRGYWASILIPRGFTRMFREDRANREEYYVWGTDLCLNYGYEHR